MKKFVAWCLSAMLLLSVAVCVTVASAEDGTPTPVLLLEGERLMHDRDRYKWGAQQMESRYDEETGIVRWTATGGDPYCHLLAGKTLVGPVVAIRYRTDTPVSAKIYAADVDRGELGLDWNDEYNSFMFAYIGDGEWHLKVLDLEEYLPDGAYNSDTNVLNHFRLDFINSAYEGEWVEVEYVAFFNSEEDAQEYDRIRLSGEGTAADTTAVNAQTETAEETAAAEETTSIPCEENTVSTDRQAGGCTSVVGSVGALAVMWALGAGVAIRKKKD